MDFYDVLDQVLDLLRQRGRVTYNALAQAAHSISNPSSKTPMADGGSTRSGRAVVVSPGFCYKLLADGATRTTTHAEGWP